MAITNPNLLAGVDTNGTNQGTPAAALITDGYLFQSIPKSADINRYLKELYRAVHFSEETGIWQWSNSISYSSGARIMRDEIVYKSLSDANSGNDPLTAPTFWEVDKWTFQTSTHNIAADSDYTLTAKQNDYGRIVITDTGVVLTVARNIIVDNIQKAFVVQNDTLQILTFKTLAGIGVAVNPGAYTELYNDGTNIFILSQEVGVNQTWVNKTGVRSDNVEYTNTQGKPIMVQVIAAATTSATQFIVDGLSISIFDSVDADKNTHTAIVPNGSTYKSFNAGAFSWHELT